MTQLFRLSLRLPFRVGSCSRLPRPIAPAFYGRRRVGKSEPARSSAGADTLPWLGALFIPILLGLRYIYPWMAPTASMSASFSAGHKLLYFKVPFFILRAGFYFVLWSWMAHRQSRTSKGSGLGLVAYVLTVSFASFDWVMSLEPGWSSSIYGAMLMMETS